MMCESDLQTVENLIRSAMASILVDEQTDAICDLAECLKTIKPYL